MGRQKYRIVLCKWIRVSSWILVFFPPFWHCFIFILSIRSFWVTQKLERKTNAYPTWTNSQQLVRSPKKQLQLKKITCCANNWRSNDINQWNCSDIYTMTKPHSTFRINISWELSFETGFFFIFHICVSQRVVDVMHLTFMWS